MSLCRIKNHHSSFRNLKLKRLIWQRSVYCENECHNKISLFIHTGRNITINMDIIQMFFLLLSKLCCLPVATQHSHTCQPFLVHCDCWNISESKPMLNIPPGDEKSGWGKTPDIKVTYKKLPGAQNQYGKK